MADEENEVIFDIVFGRLMFFKEEDEFVICFRTEDADSMDLFYVKARDEIKEAFNL